MARTWRPRSLADRLRVPIGVGADGRPVELDLKESAQDGMGPHGLLRRRDRLRQDRAAAHAGARRSRSRTRSETLNFVLVDFKGGATFAGWTGCRTPRAVITNLADELTLVDRMGDAISGELSRRQELLRAAGNYASMRDYEKARAAGAPLAAAARRSSW